MTTDKLSKRETELAGEIRSLEKLARSAAQRGSFAPAVAARSKVSALRTERDRLRAEREADAETDPLERVRRLGRLAREAGSYTAAAGLAKLEAEIVEARLLASGAAGDGLDDATDDEILTVVVAAIQALPDVLVQRVQGACEDRLAGKLRAV